MKLSFKYVSLLIGLAFAVEEIHAQTFNYQIKTSLLSPFVNTLNLGFEHKLGVDKSIQYSFFYMNYQGGFNTNTTFIDTYYSKGIDENIKGVGATIDYRIHFNDNGFSSPYLAPFFRVMHLQRTVNEYVDYYNIYYPSPLPDLIYENDRYTSVGLGFVVGKQFTFQDRFSFDLFVGPAYQIMVDKYRYAYNKSANTQIEPDQDHYFSKLFSNRLVSGYGIRAGINFGFLF